MQTIEDMPACWLDDEPARALRSVLDRAGLPAWATGGAVRDGLLPGRPRPKVAEILVAGPTPAVEAAMATGPFVREGRLSYRCTPEEWHPLRLRLVPLGPGNPRAALDADAQGRDFTINAVRCDLAGRIEDPLGGVGDMARGRVRLAAPSSLRDDPVRVLRYARMRALLGEGEPDPESLGEALAYAPRLAGAPDAAVLREMLRLMLLPDRAMARALGDLDRLGALDGVAYHPDRHRLGAFLRALAPGEPARADPFLRLGVLALARDRRGAWSDGLRPRWGDARDRRVAAPAGILREGAPGDDAVSFVRYGIPAAEARAVASALARPDALAA